MKVLDLFPKYSKTEDSLTHAPTYYCSWKDFRDAELSKWPDFRGLPKLDDFSLAILALRRRPQAVRYLDESLREPLTLFELMKQFPRSFRYLEPEYVTEEMADGLGGTSVRYFIHLPDRFQIEKRWWSAIEYDFGWNVLESHILVALPSHLGLGVARGFISNEEDLKRLCPVDKSFWKIFGPGLEPFIHESNPLLAYEATYKFQKMPSKAKKMGKVVI